MAYKWATNEARMLVWRVLSSRRSSGRGICMITWARKAMACEPHMTWSGRPPGMRWMAWLLKPNCDASAVKTPSTKLKSTSDWNVWICRVSPSGAIQIGNQWSSTATAVTTFWPCSRIWGFREDHWLAMIRPMESQQLKINGSMVMNFLSPGNPGMLGWLATNCIMWNLTSSSAIAKPFWLIRSILWSRVILTAKCKSLVVLLLAGWSPAPQTQGLRAIWHLLISWVKVSFSREWITVASVQSVGSCVPMSAYLRKAMAKAPQSSDVKNNRCSLRTMACWNPKATARFWSTVSSPSCEAPIPSQVWTCKIPSKGDMKMGTQWRPNKATVTMGMFFLSTSGWSFAQHWGSKPLFWIHAENTRGSIIQTSDGIRPIFVWPAL